MSVLYKNVTGTGVFPEEKIITDAKATTQSGNAKKIDITGVPNVEKLGVHTGLYIYDGTEVRLIKDIRENIILIDSPFTVALANVDLKVVRRASHTMICLLNIGASPSTLNGVILPPDVGPTFNDKLGVAPFVYSVGTNQLLISS